MKEVEIFIKKFGFEQQTVTTNFATKAIGTNYDVKDGFMEFCDNAYDARIKGSKLVVTINVDNDNHTLSFRDNGTGMENDVNLFKLGGTDKEKDKNKIGKFGIGVSGAVSAIATQCVYDKTDLVEVCYKSSRNGHHFEKHVAITPNGDMYLGKASFSDCNIDEHYTEVIFNNVQVDNIAKIVLSMEETFEYPIQKDMDIIVNGRRLGQSADAHRTFNDDINEKKISVGEYTVDVKWCIINGSKGDKERKLPEASLRIYDKSSGRLLAKSLRLWKLFGMKEAQQTICGLRTAIFIDSSLESYKLFGIQPAKNGITLKDYTDKMEFLDLVTELSKIYNLAAGKNCAKVNIPSTISYNGVTYFIRQSIDESYGKFIIINDKEIDIKKKYSTNDVIELIDDIRILKQENKKLKDKLNKKTKSAKA